MQCSTPFQILNTARSVLFWLSHAWDTASAKEQFHQHNVFFCLLAMHNCRWKDKYNIPDSFSCPCQINKCICFGFFFFLKNNLRKINCTVMEVKYCQKSKALIWLLTFYYCVFEHLFVSHSAESLVSVEVSLCYDSCSFALFCFGTFSSQSFSIHSRLICSPSAYLNTIAPVMHMCTSDNSKVNSSLPKLSICWS